MALYAHRPEQELVDELLERVCAVLDPAAAVAVTRDGYGQGQPLAMVGWTGSTRQRGLSLGSAVARAAGKRPVGVADRWELVERDYRVLLATPIAYRGVYLGFVAVLDKEQRGEDEAGFTAEDRRFLESVASLAGVALDGARQHETLEAQRDRWRRRTGPSSRV